MLTRRFAVLALPLLGTACSSGINWSLIEQIQDAVGTACGFVPFIKTILAILNLHDPNLQTVGQIVDAICHELGGVAPARRHGIGATGANVHGVPLEGEYIQRF